MVQSVSAGDTICFRPRDAQFQYMERRVSIHGTHSFSTWNAGFQYMERTVSSPENAVVSSLFKALVGFFKGYTDVFFGISNIFL